MESKSDIETTCLECGQFLSSVSEHQGAIMDCPACGQRVTLFPRPHPIPAIEESPQRKRSQGRGIILVGLAALFVVPVGGGLILGSIMDTNFKTLKVMLAALIGSSMISGIGLLAKGIAQLLESLKQSKKPDKKKLSRRIGG